MNKLLFEMLKYFNEDEYIKFNEIIDKALEEECTISLEKTKENTEIKIKGSSLAILLNLIGLEKALLKDSNVDNTFFKCLRDILGVEYE